MKTVITMTSWLGRIHSVGFAIYNFLRTQTIHPDDFYLFLSKTEFPAEFSGLPDDLNAIIRKFNIHVVWLNDNEYCFKRWYVYPKHYDDIVISIDDDVLYDHRLIEYAKHRYADVENTIINIGSPIYKPILFDNSIIRHFDSVKLDIPIRNGQLCGQCIVCPHTFPCDSLDPTNIQIRKTYCPKCDECGLTPWLVHQKTEFIHHNWNNKIIASMQSTGLASVIRNTKDLQLYLVLRAFPHLLPAWRELYSSYNTNQYDSYTLDEIRRLI